MRGAILVRRSGNGKLTKKGRPPVAATYSARKRTCPRDCPLWEACYYATGYRTGKVARRLDKESARLSSVDVARAECELILAVTRPRSAMRMHVGGDCTTGFAARLCGDAAATWQARGGGPVWTYSHAWRTVERAAWGGGVSVLASCETLAEARLAMSRGYAASVVVEAHPADGKAYQVGDVKVVPCPAQTRDGMVCVDCRLCWDDKARLGSRAVVAFEAHGTGRAAAVDTVRQANARLAIVE